MENSATVLSDRRSISTTRKWLFLIVAILVGGSALLVYTNWPTFYNFVSTNGRDIEELDILKEEVHGSTSLGVGQFLIFSAVPADADFLVPNLFALNVDTKTTQSFIEYPTRSFATQTISETLAIAYVTDTENSDGWQPAWFDVDTDSFGPLVNVGGYNMDHFTLSPNGVWYSYSVQQAIDADPFNLETWNVSLHNIETGEIRQIPAAAKPVFLNNEQDLIVMKTDGLYRYNIIDATLNLFSDEYIDLSIVDGYAISPNSQTLVMTLPATNTISIQSIELGNLYDEAEVEVQSDLMLVANETVVLSTLDARPQSPIFAPDNITYAILLTSNSAVDQNNNQYSNAVVEIRDLRRNEIVDTLTFSEVDIATVRLEGWLHNQ